MNGTTFARRVVAQANRWIDRMFGPTRLKLRARKHPVRIVVGASGIAPRGWIPTEARYLDLTRPALWEKYFQERSIQAILAEHVWEHLAPDQARQAVRTCRTFLQPNGRLRIAVPDGYHPDPVYIDHVKVGGIGPGADDHKVLYTFETLTDLLRSEGFEVDLLEWWDAGGTFHAKPWDIADGLVQRTSKRDLRNADGTLRYTSLLVDAFPA